ncbi:MAG: FkbM family methyltransferase [Planctomycetaceae bacterium]|jgi:FkbM family methyltransferase|nr:FkbM family methyltransferase [Planctomycetaceae bacterium]
MIFRTIHKEIIKGVRKVKYKLFGSGRIVKRKQSILQFPYYLREGTSDERVEQDVFRIKQIHQKEDFGTPHWIIDAGANIGLRTIWFANMFPETNIIAIEPEKTNFDLLRQNTAFYSNVRCVQAGLWKNNAYLKIRNPNDEPWAFIIDEVTKDEEHTDSERDLSSHQSPQNDEVIRGITVEYLMKEYAIDNIDVLKIDIEGSEKEVFDNSAQWINSVNLFFIELHDRMKNGCAKSFFNAIGHLDYKFLPEYRGDNIIVTVHT